MGRPKKWENDAERKASKRTESNSKRTETEVVCPDTRVNGQINGLPDVSSFDGHGRGVPVNGYVLISLGAVEEGKPEGMVISEAIWRDRLDKRCQHGLLGWSCKKCLH